MHLFSASESLVEYGRQHCRVQSSETSTLVMRLFAGFRVENLTMPVEREEFLRDARKFILQQLPAEVRLEGISPEERLQGIPLGQRLQGIPLEQRLQGLTPDEREKLRRLLEEPPAG